MKKGKRILALLLAMIMVLAMSATVFAESDEEGGESTNYSITVNNAQDGETYTAYKILDVSYNSSTELYTYTIDENSVWYPLLSSEDGESYFVLTYDEENNCYVVTVVEEKTGEEIAQFLANNVPNGAEAITASVSGGSATFSNVKDGYYLITSSLGTRLILDTVVDGFEINSKNGIPTVEKKIVEEDEEVDSTSASIGDTVNFQITITAYAGAVNYVVTDTLSAGLTYNNDIEIYVNDEEVDDENYEVDTSEEEITIKFDQNYLDELTESLEMSQTEGSTSGSIEIVIKYSATLNSDATSGVDETGYGKNTNKVKLSYGDGSSTEEDIVYVSTFDFTLVKMDEDGDEIEVEDNVYATFELTAGSVKYYFTYDEETGRYTVTSSDTTGSTSEIEVKITSDEGVTIYGLEAGDYTLTETQAPTGYNILTESIEITIEDDGTVKIGGKTTSDETITVVNTSGSVLPSTGGMGTTILYIAGIALVLFAGIMLVTRRRMSR